MKNLNKKKLSWLLAGVLFIGLIAAVVAYGPTALAGNKSQPSASGTGPAVSWVVDNPQPGSGPSSPDRVNLAGKIDRLDSSGFQLLQGPRYEEADRVIVSIDQNTRIVDARGQTLKFADLKQGQEVIFETDPVTIMIFPAQMKAYSVTVLN